MTVRALSGSIRRRASLLLALGVALWGQAALAQDASVDEARARMEKAQRLFADEKYAEAEAEFESGYKAQPYKAFLYNAAVAAEHAGDKPKAIAHYREFLAAEPNAPDAGDIRAAIDRLEKDQSNTAPPSTEPQAAMRSVLIVLSDPKGAPTSIYFRIPHTTTPFDPKGGPNQAGWKSVATNLSTPVDMPLPVGSYHVQVQPFKDYKGSDTDVDLQAGTVYVYKAGLSQGEFVGKIAVKGPVGGAKVFLDDPTHKNAPTCSLPCTFDASPGDHTVNVFAPGWVELSKPLTVKQGEMQTVQADLARVDYGYLLFDANVEEMKVKVDGKSEPVHHHGDGPLRMRLTAGKHDVVVDASGMNALKQKIEVPGGQSLPVKAKLNESAGKGGGVGMAFLSAGAIGGGTALWLLSGRQDPTDKQNFRYGAIGCFAGAGVFAGLSIFFFAYDPSDKSTVKLGPAKDFEESDVDRPAAKAPAAGPPSKPAKSSLLDGLRMGIAPVIAPGVGGAAISGTF